MNFEAVVPDVEEQKGWLIDIGGSLKALQGEENKAKLDQCKILYEVHKIWDEVDTEVKGFWNYDFFDWAATYTQNDAVSLPDKSTILNKIYVYRDFMSEEATIEIPKKVKVLRLNEADKPVGDGSAEHHWEEVDTPDLRKIPYTKLVRIRRVAIDDEMTDELWNMVFDKSCSVKKLTAQIKGLELPDGFLVESEGLVSYRKDGEERLVAVIYFEDEDDIWKEGVEKLLKGASSKTVDLV
jgi:hypothetical protein